MGPSILLIIACSLSPQGTLCQAYGGPCVVLQQNCPSDEPNIDPRQVPKRVDNKRKSG